MPHRSLLESVAIHAKTECPTPFADSRPGEVPEAVSNLVVGSGIRGGHQRVKLLLGIVPMVRIASWRAIKTRLAIQLALNPTNGFHHLDDHAYDRAFRPPAVALRWGSLGSPISNHQWPYLSSEPLFGLTCLRFIVIDCSTRKLGDIGYSPRA